MGNVGLGCPKRRSFAGVVVRANLVAVPNGITRSGGRLPAFTLLELLVVIAVVSLLIGIAMPSLSAARRKGIRARCLANLRELATASAGYANADSQNLIMPAHPISDRNPLHDEGYYDYGGATGADNVWAGQRFGPASPRSAPTRPLNKYLYGAVSDSSDLSLFRCPADTGLSSRESTSTPVYVPAMSIQPMFRSVGTSYWGNAYRGTGPSETGTNGANHWSVGVFLRPLNRVPDAAQTVLYCEASAWDQFTGRNSSSFTIKGEAGWHGEGRFNFAFCDGHAETIRLAGGALSSGSPETDPKHYNLHLRGPGFRFDCLPDGLIEDKPDE
jgi:prepilin-type processing-associated H-X9-DG protein/prepilin-type N-terminal cleavage/methylation domain-containing protein